MYFSNQLNVDTSKLGVDANNILFSLYLYFYERKYIKYNILLYRYKNDTIFFLTDNQATILHVAYAHTLELRDTLK